MRLIKTADRWMLKHIPKYRLRRICKAIGIRPYPWQKQFALGEFGHLPPLLERGEGKTTAVMLRLLMQEPRSKFCALSVLHADPDFDGTRMVQYGNEYRKLKNRCLEAGVPVIQMELYKMVQRYRG